MAQLKALSEKMRENADYVGDKFAEEARKIHFGETDARGIYGEATPEEAEASPRTASRSCRSRCFPTTGTDIFVSPALAHSPQVAFLIRSPPKA